MSPFLFFTFYFVSMHELYGLSCISGSLMHHHLSIKEQIKSLIKYFKYACVLCITWAPGMGAKGLVGLRTGWLYIIGWGAITGTPPIWPICGGTWRQRRMGTKTKQKWKTEEPPAKGHESQKQTEKGEKGHEDRTRTMKTVGPSIFLLSIL